MKAVALTHYLPIDDPASLLDMDLPAPSAPAGYDLLVRVEAVSVNPVDTKLRAPKAQTLAAPKVLGFDAAGVFKPWARTSPRLRSATRSITQEIAGARAATPNITWWMRASPAASRRR